MGSVSLREEIARVLADDHDPETYWKEWTEEGQSYWLAKADAVLAVVLKRLREPSGDCVDTAWERCAIASKSDIKTAWDAMLDQFAKDNGL